MRDQDDAYMYKVSLKACNDVMFFVYDSRVFFSFRSSIG